MVNKVELKDKWSDSVIGDPFIETPSRDFANRVAMAKNPDGSQMYRSGEYDKDRKLYIFVKRQPKKVIAQVALPVAG